MTLALEFDEPGDADRIRATYEDVCQRLASDDDVAAANELADMYDCESVCELLRDVGPLVSLRAYNQELEPDADVDEPSRYEPRRFQTSLREFAQEARGSVLQRLAREVGRAALPLGIIELIRQLPDLDFDRAVEHLQAGGRLVEVDGRLADRAAPQRPWSLPPPERDPDEPELEP